nr:Bromodomain-containing protein 8 [Polyrhizophydium stewartii]
MPQTAIAAPDAGDWATADALALAQAVHLRGQDNWDGVSELLHSFLRGRPADELAPRVVDDIERIRAGQWDARLLHSAPKQFGQESAVFSSAALHRASSETDPIDPDSGAEGSDGPDRKRQRVDDKYRTWKRTAMLIWNRIADHRAGNAFLKTVKDKSYLDFVKQPMSLDLVKARIREGITKTTAEFHRDVLHVLANAVMFNPEDSEIYSMASEMKEYVDSEMRSLLVCTARNETP